jgi:dTMP kinase
MAFIVFEGGEGVGKTTQLNLLKERLPQLFPKREIIFTKEPGGTPFAAKIAALVLADGAKEASGETMSSLFIAARYDHVENLIAPALAAGKAVICDRYVAATYAYQVRAHHAPELLPTYTEHFKLLGSSIPDMTIILDLDPAIALARLAKRSETEASTHYDQRELSFHQELREGYTEWAERFAPKKSVFIDANKSAEELHQDIITIITPFLNQSSGI